MTVSSILKEWHLKLGYFGVNIHSWNVCHFSDLREFIFRKFLENGLKKYAVEFNRCKIGKYKLSCAEGELAL